jgi:hypothetical protein
MIHNENKTLPDRNAVLSVRENPDGAQNRRRGIVGIDRSAASWIEKSSAVDAMDGLTEVLRVLDLAREKLGNPGRRILERCEGEPVRDAPPRRRSNDIESIAASWLN